MARTGSPAVDRGPAVPAAGAAALDLVLPADRRERGESRAHATDRRAVFGDALLRQPEAGGGAESQSQARAAADAQDGPGGDLPAAANDLAGGGTQDLPVFTAESGDSEARPGVGDGHHLRAAAAWLSVPRGDHGLVQPACAGVAAVEHALRELLPGGARRSLELGDAGDLQQRSRKPVHGRGVHVAAGGPWRGRQYGRPWSSLGQRIRGAAVAEREVRGGLPKGLRRRLGGGGETDRLLSVLLAPADSPSPRLPHSGGGLSTARLKTAGPRRR